MSYSSSPAVYRTDIQIPPNVATVTGTIDTFSVSPGLPAGLALNASTGQITGMCSAPVAAADYVVTAANGSGMTQSTVNIEVLWHESKSLLPKASPTEADLRHFLDRTHFGFSQTHWDALQAMGLDAYVTAMTTFADTTQLETDAAGLYLIDPVNDPNGDFPSQNDLARYWLYMIMLNANPFQEMLTFHWMEHFAANTQVLRDNTGDDSLHYFISYINLFRHDGAGNLKQLMLDMALEPAMLVFLDSILNRDGSINENFGREWFELFAFGVDIDYTQQDIIEASRAFTGFRNRNDPNTGKDFIEFDQNRHDDEEKTVLGVTIPAQTPGNEVDEYDQVVDITFNHNEAGTGHSRVGQWIARSLLRYFVYDDPPQNVVNELADDIRDDGWELKPSLMKIFQSEAFFSALARKGLVKGPVEHIAGFMRTTNLVGDPAQIDSRLNAMGHRPTQPPGVDGWPGGTQWLSGQGMVDRANALNYLTEQAQTIQGNLNIFARDLLPVVPGTSAVAVATLVERLNITLSPAELSAAENYLDTERTGGGVVNPSPFDQLDPVNDLEEIENRVRGLLWVLAQHPTYVIR